MFGYCKGLTLMHLNGSLSVLLFAFWLLLTIQHAVGESLMGFAGLLAQFWRLQDFYILS